MKVQDTAIAAAKPHGLAVEKVRLKTSDRDRWADVACWLHYPDFRDLDAWKDFRASSVSLAQFFLPPAMKEALDRFFAPDGNPALILENLPVDPNLPPIPTDGLRPENKQAVSESVITGILSHWGEILSFFNEKSGSPIHEVTPVAGKETLQSNAGKVRFGFHSDNAFLPPFFRQAGILLYGLRNRNTATTVLTAEQILEAAPPALAAKLARPLFRHACPASYSFEGQALFSAPRPILFRDELGMARVTAASSVIEPVEEEHRHALEEFRELVDSLTPLRIVIGPGTALLFKDDRVLHGRDQVSGPRWLQRAYFTDSLELQRWVTVSRPEAFAFDPRRLLD